jgi:hypothetical protein
MIENRLPSPAEAEKEIIAFLQKEGIPYRIDFLVVALIENEYSIQERAFIASLHREIDHLLCEKVLRGIDLQDGRWTIVQPSISAENQGLLHYYETRWPGGKVMAFLKKEGRVPYRVKYLLRAMLDEEFAEKKSHLRQFLHELILKLAANGILELTAQRYIKVAESHQQA